VLPRRRCSCSQPPKHTLRISRNTCPPPQPPTVSIKQTNTMSAFPISMLFYFNMVNRLRLCLLKNLKKKKKKKTYFTPLSSDLGNEKKLGRTFCKKKTLRQEFESSVVVETSLFTSKTTSWFVVEFSSIAERKTKKQQGEVCFVQ